MIKILITDLDGTLVDTFEANLKAYQQAFSEVGLNLAEHDYRSCYGLRFDRFMEKMGIVKKNVALQIKKAKAEVYPQYFDSLRVNKVLAHLLLTFQKGGGKIAVASTARKKNLMAVLNHIGMTECWDYIVAGEEVPVSKPDPYIYLQVLKYFGLKANEALVFEDSPVGMEAAMRAGVNFIHINDVYYGD